jgi:hypothetical protein
MRDRAGALVDVPPLRIVVLLLAVAVITFHLVLALQDRGLARDQHLGTAVEYAQGEIDLLRPIILGHNANDAPTPLEFPIWQALTAVWMKIFGPWLGWGNVVSLLFHLSGLWPVFHLAKGLISQRAADWAMIFYLLQPMPFLWGGTAGVDSMAASLALWFVYCGWRMIETPAWFWWLAACVVGLLSATTKAPFFMVAGLTLFFWVLRDHRKSPRTWLKLIFAGALGVAAFVLWNHHAELCYQAAEMPYWDLRIGGDIRKWWFGDLSTRFDSKNWLRAGWRISAGLLGSFALLALVIPAVLNRSTGPLRLWLLAGLCATLVFTELILFHWHYYYIFAVPFALLCGFAVEKCEAVFWRLLPPLISLRLAVLSLVAGATLVQGLQAAHVQLYLDTFPADVARVIKAHSSPSDKIVFWGGGWGFPLLRSEREGLTIANWDPLTDPAKLNRLKQLGYNKLVLINIPPLAIAVNNAAGTGGFVTRNLPEELPPVAENWLVLFQSDTILIVEIPK